VYLDDTLGQISPHKKLTDTNDILNVYCYPSFSPDGTKILYTSRKSGTEEIWSMDSSGLNKTKITTTNATRTRRPRYSPDGNTIAFYSNLWISGTDSLQIYTINANISNSPLDTITRSGNCYDPSWKYNGQQIIFAKNTKPGKSYIYIIDKDGNNESKLINDSKSYYPIWRPSRQ
jgi:TolB protein